MRNLTYKELKAEGVRLLNEGRMQEALELFLDAQKTMPDDPKIADKVKRLREYIKEQEEAGESESENQDMFEVGEGFFVHHSIYSKLFAYQREGVLWMWKLFQKKRGGVLGDEMGLGKTVQVIAFLSGMFDAELIRSVLIVMPVSLIANWVREFDRWAPGIRVYDHHSANTEKQRQQLLRSLYSRPGVLITSYGLIQTKHEQLTTRNGSPFVWSYVILDEGHKIKNPTKTQRCVYDISAKNRLVLTGTAVQNNLLELWALYNFTHQGALLGSQQTFKTQFEAPITRAREKDATVGERHLGVQIANNLKQLIAPYFLRRTKAEVLTNQKRPTAAAGGEGKSPAVREGKENDAPPPVPSFDVRKNDIVLWVFLTEIQQRLYRDFLNSDQVKSILMTKRSPLVQLNILKKICDHPRLLSHRACSLLGLSDQSQYDEDDPANAVEGMRIDNVSDETLLEESGKVAVLMELLEQLKKEGHSTLVFSQSKRILTILQRLLRARSFSVTRMDGDVHKMSERDRIVNEFQSGSGSKRRADVFLLTTQVGGVGLTLTAADRVVIFDLSWNPATDAQAVDRAYRIGQNRNVVVYRLITCSTIEEKIYRRQIFKDSIIKQTTSKQEDPSRYFTKQELRELFTLEDPMQSKTQQQLEQLHSHKRVTDAQLENHLKFLGDLNIFGVSHHDLMFTDKEAAIEEGELCDQERQFVSSRVQMAQKVVNIEAQVLANSTQNTFRVPNIIRNQGLRIDPHLSARAPPLVARTYNRVGQLQHDVKFTPNSPHFYPLGKDKPTPGWGRVKSSGDENVAGKTFGFAQNAGDDMVDLTTDSIDDDSDDDVKPPKTSAVVIPPLHNFVNRYVDSGVAATSKRKSPEVIDITDDGHDVSGGVFKKPAAVVKPPPAASVPASYGLEPSVSSEMKYSPKEVTVDSHFGLERTIAEDGADDIENDQNVGEVSNSMEQVKDNTSDNRETIANIRESRSGLRPKSAIDPEGKSDVGHPENIADVVRATTTFVVTESTVGTDVMDVRNKKNDEDSSDDENPIGGRRRQQKYRPQELASDSESDSDQGVDENVGRLNDQYDDTHDDINANLTVPDSSDDDEIAASLSQMTVDDDNNKCNDDDVVVSESDIEDESDHYQGKESYTVVESDVESNDEVVPGTPTPRKCVTPLQNPRKHRRLTPLRIAHSGRSAMTFSEVLSPFQKALARSVELSPEGPVKSPVVKKTPRRSVALKRAPF